jgi:hypothetical protein
MAQTMRSTRKRDVATILPVALAVLMVLASPIGFFVVPTVEARARPVRR